MMNLLLCFGVVFAVVCRRSERSLTRCKLPENPENGHFHNDRPYLLKGTTLQIVEGSTLRIVCDRGFKLKGAKEAVCKNGQWTTALGKCKAVMCQPLTASRLTISNPASCLTRPSPYLTGCTFSCPPGYYGGAELVCFTNGQWKGRYDVCKDRQRPDLKCPLSRKVITHESDPGKATAKIRLPLPSYSDNSEAHGGKLSFSATLDGKPVSVKQEHELSITITHNDNHKVKYVVTDETGNEATCYFYYHIQDNEAPKISCPSNITRTTKKGENTMRVSWKKPTVTDNSGKDLWVHCNPLSGEFRGGDYLIKCFVSDRSHNRAFCEFHVTVKVPCVDFAAFYPAIIWPKTCSYLASNLTKCDDVVSPLLPKTIVWKNVCGKTCKAC